MTGDGYHCPVMLEEVLCYMLPKPGQRVLDVTLGGGGHARGIIDKIGPGGTFVGLDRDPDAIEHAEKLCGDGVKIFVLKGKMGELSGVVGQSKIEKFDAILADLGVSSHQLGCVGRGFSFRNSAPLDMRMDPTTGLSAADFLEGLSKEEIERIIWNLGEEKFAARIAASIASYGRISTTGELAEIVERSYPRMKGRRRIHPATKTFQAIRIAVNDELGELDSFLQDAPYLLAKNGRLVVIGYHSLEDRRVKKRFRELEKLDEFCLPRRRSIRPTVEEITANPRSRSARMRVLERVK